MITEDYVSFETAKLLKEKGFDWECFQYWHEDDNELVHSQSMHPIQNVSNPCFFGPAAPTLQTAMKWLRKEKGIAIIPILSSILDNEKFLWDVKIVVAKTGESYSQGWIYEEQEEAFDTAIRYCLKNLI